MAGMGPAPKPRDQRARGNKPPTADVTLPASGYRGEIPAWPFDEDKPHADQLQLWGQLWRTPQAAVWIRLGPGMARVVGRYVKTWWNPAAIRDTELRQLEDRLGLNPLAMRRLGWEVGSDEDSDDVTGSGGVVVSGPWDDLRVTE